MANIVVFGCRKITTDFIDFVCKHRSQHKITLVVNHDIEKDKIYNHKLVAEKCSELRIPTTKFDKKVDASQIVAAKPDIIFSLHYRLILKEDVLNIPQYGCINMHVGFLPRDRGPAPVLWNILNGDKFAGATLHYMTKDIDAGDVIVQKQIEIGDQTGFELNCNLMDIGTELLISNFDNIVCGNVERFPQDNNLATHTLRFSEGLRYIMWMNPNYIMNQIRAFTFPLDGAIAYNKKCTLIANRGHISCKRNSLAPPGSYELKGNNITVQTCTLPVVITDYKILSGTLSDSGRFLSVAPGQTT